MGVKYKDGKIEDLIFTINLTYNCNLNCSYCNLEKKEKNISKKILDNYINFLINNKSEIFNICNNIEIIFSGGEPLLLFDKIEYFIEKTFHLNIKYVIYTNGLLINKQIIDKLKKYLIINNKIIFFISLDGGKKISLNNRLFNDIQFEKIIENVNKLKNNNINIAISKVILKESPIELYNNLKFIYGFGLEMLEFIPVNFYYKDSFNYNDIKNIIKGFELFIDYLKNKGLSELNILEYFGLPDNICDIKKLYQVEIGLYGDIDGKIYGIINALKSSSIFKTFTKNELNKINIGDIKDDKKILEIIKNYNDFENDMYDVGLKWLDRELPINKKIFSMLRIYFIKKLLLYNYKKTKLICD